jgi:dienelactone hydrolase
MKVEPITYSSGDTRFAGALVYDETVNRQRPAILMAPNWMGVRQLAYERAELIAGDRYVVFVADMYGEGRRPKDFAEAASFANPLREDAAESRKRIRAAFDTLVAEGNRRGVINQYRGAIGFCFGGGNVLELARDGADVHGVVSIHGDLKTTSPAAKGAVKAPLLVLHGAPDPVVPKEHRDAFEAEMDAAGARWEMVVFSGILHAYTDLESNVPGVAIYDEPATRQSYGIMHTFLADAFAKRL